MDWFCLDINNLIKSTFSFPGNKKCNGRGCKTCDYIKETDTFKSKATGESYTMSISVTCKTKGVVYLIECSKCGIQYVGMTKNALQKRFTSHRCDIKNKKKTSVAKHFNLPGHSKEDLTIMIIDQEDNVKKLRKRERDWINKLETKTHGLNRR